MLPEYCPELCLRPDVIAVRYPGENLEGRKLRDHENSEHVQAVMELPDLPSARYLVFDVRNFKDLSDKFVTVCVMLWKKLQAMGCRFVLLCGQEYHELLTFIKLDKLLSVLPDEAALEKLLAADEADTPTYVACRQA